MSTVTIGFVPRERFSLAAEALERIFSCTEIPFNLVVVNCNIPPMYWQQMEKVLSGRDNVKVLHVDRYLLPNQSRNLVIDEAKDDYLCFIENDVLVKEGWLSQLMTACEEYPADVAIPLIMQGRLRSRMVHFDDLLGEVEEIETPEGPKLQIRKRRNKKELDRGTPRRTVQFVEQHCVFFRRSALDKIGRYAEDINTRDEIDLSLAIRQAKLTIVFEPKCEVHYLPPYTLDPPLQEETDFYFMKWDLKHAAESRERIREKWNLVETPGDMGFVKERNLVGQVQVIRKELIDTIPTGEPFILLDQAWWHGTRILDDLSPIPFIEKDGKYWGEPADDKTAIEELERLLGRGVRFVVVGWPAFCWLEYYPGLNRYLRSKFRPVLENDRLIAFDVRS